MSRPVKWLYPFVLVVLVFLMSAAGAVCGDLQRQTPAFVPGSWSLVLLPDSQCYAWEYPGLFTLQTHWIAKNKEKYDIRYVLHLGDLTQENTDLQWRRAQEGFSELDGKVPYALVLGNHDHHRSKNGAPEPDPNQYFPPSKFACWPTFGGTMRENDIRNSYHLFSAGGIDWIIIALDFAPRNDAIQWANEVLAKYPQRKAILLTHAYLRDDNARDTIVKKYIKDKTDTTFNDGEQLWQKLVCPNNFAMTINGHVSGTGFLSSRNSRGRITQQMLVDYQRLNMEGTGNVPKSGYRPQLNFGGGAYLRILEFLPDGKTVQVKSYSPLYEKYLNDEGNQFTFELDL